MLLHAFRGDLDWIHQLEGHRGHPYWPETAASGVTLDPGFDLGHQTWERLEEVYGPFLEARDLARLGDVVGLRGEAAKVKAHQLSDIEVSREVAQRILRKAMEPYWWGIALRFPTLFTAPPAVQTVLLSLAYNRGRRNRDLEVLGPPLVHQQWSALPNLIGSMQQDHRSRGVRRRRRLEADYLRERVEDG